MSYRVIAKLRPMLRGKLRATCRYKTPAVKRWLKAHPRFQLHAMADHALVTSTPVISIAAASPKAAKLIQAPAVFGGAGNVTTNVPARTLDAAPRSHACTAWRRKF